MNQFQFADEIARLFPDWLNQRVGSETHIWKEFPTKTRKRSSKRVACSSIQIRISTPWPPSLKVEVINLSDETGQEVTRAKPILADSLEDAKEIALLAVEKLQ